MAEKRYILTFSCIDARGIVAAVTGFIAAQDGFIIESAQFGDASTGRFFLRMEFSAGPKTPEEDTLRGYFREQVAAPFSMQWQMVDKARKSRLLIMVSRHGHCLNDLLHRYRTGQLRIELRAVVSNHPDFREVVEWHGVPFHHFPLAEGKEAQEARILETIEREAIDTVVLARYMQILSPALSEALSGKAINIHHSFLPSFKGARPYHQAFDKGVKLIGATAHYVTNDLDEGPIIEQEVARVDHTATPADLAAIGHDIESLVLAHALKYHTEHRVLLNAHKTVVFR